MERLKVCLHNWKVHLGPVYIEWGTRSSGVGFFCFHALGDTKEKKPTPLDQGPPLHVNRVLVYPASLQATVKIL